METFTIGQIADRFGLTHRALRFYEGRGLVAPRREGTRRFYCDRDVRRLAWIVDLTRAGFGLTETGKIVDRIDRGEAVPVATILTRISEIEAETIARQDALLSLRSKIRKAAA